MESIITALPYVQIALSILLAAGVLLQQRGSSLGGAFGGDNFSATFHKRSNPYGNYFTRSKRSAYCYLLNTVIRQFYWCI